MMVITTDSSPGAGAPKNVGPNEEYAKEEGFLLRRQQKRNKEKARVG